MELIVHTEMDPTTGEVSHNIQSDNLARLEHAMLHMQEHGYQVQLDLISQKSASGKEYHSVHYWSLEDGIYTPASLRKLHTPILRMLKIPVNKVHISLHIVSTYATVKSSRTRKPIR